MNVCGLSLSRSCSRSPHMGSSAARSSHRAGWTQRKKTARESPPSAAAHQYFSAAQFTPAARAAKDRCRVTLQFVELESETSTAIQKCIAPWRRSSPKSPSCSSRSRVHMRWGASAPVDRPVRALRRPRKCVGRSPGTPTTGETAHPPAAPALCDGGGGRRVGRPASVLYKL